MRIILSVFLSAAVVILYGCSPADQAALDSTLSHISGSVQVNPATGEVTGGVIIKEVKDPCTGETKAISRGEIYGYRSTFQRNYGRIVDTAIETRGLVTTRAQEQANGRGLKAQKDLIRHQTETDIRDLKENARREQHNASVAVNLTSNRSMKSWLYAHLFGQHETLIPLNTCAPVAEIVNVPTTTVVETPVIPATPQPIPNTNPDGSFSVPAEKKVNLESRVNALEAKMDLILSKLEKK